VYFSYSSDLPTVHIGAFSERLMYDFSSNEVKKVSEVMAGIRTLADVGYGPWARGKVTADHHTWYRPDEVMTIAPKDRLIDICVALQALAGFKETEAFAAGVLLWVSTADLSLVREVLSRADLWKNKDLKTWIKVAKGFSDPLKTHHHLTSAPLEQVFELQVLANRGIGEVDWEQEREHRVDPVCVRTEPGKVYECAVRYFQTGRAHGYHYPTESWKDYWQRRWAAAPGGSVHSQYTADDEYISHERTERTKFMALSTMPFRAINFWCRRTPEIVAWPSHKYEWAKNRAIYGTDLTSYLMTDYAMPAVEEALAHTFPVGRRANEKYVAERVQLAAAGGVALCFDYEDFNSQHTLGAQAEVISAYADVFEHAMSDEQRVAIRWVEKSAIFQRVEGPDPYRTRGTLLSGWRLTTVVNTVLNRAYLELAGCTKLFIDSVHNGDDVLAYTRSVADAVEVLKRADEFGIRAQPAKCAIGGLEEFLRVDRAASRPTGAQYLTRGVATAVHSRAEAREPDDVTALMQAQMTRTSELLARGADPALVERLRRVAVERVADVFDTDYEVLESMLSTHLVHGGLGTDPDLPIRYKFEAEQCLTDPEDVLRMAKLPGVNDYARYLAKVFDLPQRQMLKAREGVARATVRSVKLVRRALVRSPLGDSDAARAAQYLKGVCADEYAVQAHSGRARLAGLPVGRMAMAAVTSAAAARIGASNDPIRTLSLIF
jgi:hypothetical protein